MTGSSSSKARASYHHGDLRRALKDEALNVIAREGLEAVSLRGIARRLGVSEAAPYHHYSGKQELLAAIAADAYRGLHERLDAAVTAAGDDPFSRLHALGRAYIEYGLENRGRFRLMFGEHMVDLAAYEEVVEAGRPTRSVLREVVAACLGSGAVDVSSMERTTWALVHGITWLVAEAEIRAEGDETEIDRLVDTALAVLAAGIERISD